MTSSRQPVHPAIQCTVWVKDENDRFTGSMANDGGLMEAGDILVHHLGTLDDARRLVSLGALRYIAEDLNEAEKMNPKSSGPMFSNYGRGMAETVAKSYTKGAYCYVFSEKDRIWYFGLDCKHKLADMI